MKLNNVLLPLSVCKQMYLFMMFFSLYRIETVTGYLGLKFHHCSSDSCHSRQRAFLCTSEADKTDFHRAGSDCLIELIVSALWVGMLTVSACCACWQLKLHLQPWRNTAPIYVWIIRHDNPFRLERFLGKVLLLGERQPQSVNVPRHCPSLQEMMEPENKVLVWHTLDRSWQGIKHTFLGTSLTPNLSKLNVMWSNWPGSECYNSTRDTALQSSILIKERR